MCKQRCYLVDNTHQKYCFGDSTKKIKVLFGKTRPDKGWKPILWLGKLFNIIEITSWNKELTPSWLLVLIKEKHYKFFFQWQPREYDDQMSHTKFKKTVKDWQSARSPSDILQHSEPYIRVDRTQLWYSFSLVLVLYCWDLHT